MNVDRAYQVIVAYDHEKTVFKISYKDNRYNYAYGRIYPDLATLIRQVEKSGAKKVILTPLMVVAGDHAVNDMASDDENSWKIAFEAVGFQVECVLQGLGEYPQIREMYIAHVEAAMCSIV